MSMKDISEIQLTPLQIFDHSSILKQEIEKFDNNFIKNERYKEFDGLIKRNHRIYEAMDCNLLPGLQNSALKEFTEKLNKTADRLERLSNHRLNKNNFAGIDLTTLSASDIAKLAEATTKTAPEIHHMATIVECDTPRQSNDEELIDLN